MSNTIGEKFIIIIDEWDALFREVKQDKKIQKEYLRLLQELFESNSMIEAVYIIGILPIKKYGTSSALPDFHEYTMIRPQFLAEYVGFTNKEVHELCREYAKVKKGMTDIHLVRLFRYTIPILLYRQYGIKNLEIIG